MPELKDHPYASIGEIDRQSPTWTRHFVLAAICLAATIAYIPRNWLGVASDRVQADFGMGTFEMGVAMSAFFWGYSAFQIPAGWLGHRWSPRAGLAFFASFWSVCIILVGVSADAPNLIARQFAFGMTQAAIFPCCADVISKWIPTARRAMASGALGSFMSIGGAIGSAATGALLPHMTWRWILILFAIPGFVWAVGFWFWFRDRPEDHWHVNDAELQLIRQGKPAKKETVRPPTPWLAILLSFDMWMIFGQQFFRAAGYIFYATWFPKYLREIYGISTKQSGFLTALPLLAVVGGSLLGGFLVDWLWNRFGSKRISRQAVAVVAMFSCAALICFAYFITDAATAVLIISAGSFFAGLSGSCGYTVTIDKSGDCVAPIFGIMNMSGNIGASLCPLAIAMFVKLNGGNWQPVLLLFVAIYIFAGVCWMLLNPNGSIMPKTGKQ